MPKTLKLKAPEPASAAKPAAPGASGGSSDGIYVSSRHRNPMEGAGAIRKENWTWAVIVAIVSTALVAAALAMELMKVAA